MIDISKLEKVQCRGKKIIARCPACAEIGGDEQGNHLVIDGQGRFACAVHPGKPGATHRKRIFELVGDCTIKPLKINAPCHLRTGISESNNGNVEPVQKGILGRLGRVFSHLTYGEVVSLSNLKESEGGVPNVPTGQRRGSIRCRGTRRNSVGRQF